MYLTSSNIKKWTPLLAIMSVFLISCKKYLKVSPVGSISTETAYSNATNIEASVNGIYYILSQNGNFYSGAYNASNSLLSDEAKVGSSTFTPDIQYAANEITTDNSYISGLWNNNYQTIYQANMLLEHVPNTTGLDPAQKNQWIGEARFLRAYCYFVLTCYFGKVPLATTSNYKINNTLSRSDTAEVHAFITTELLQALTELPDGYDAYGGSRTRAARQTVFALLARNYLYRKDWQNAIKYATDLINDPQFNLPPLDEVVQNNSTESIWEIAYQPYQNYTATELVPIVGSASLTPILPSDKLIASFEQGDLRKTTYMGFSPTPASGFYYVNKFRDRNTLSDQPKIFRLAEMYLIRAEARAEMDSLSGAAADINKIRHRANLQDTQADAKQALLDAVGQERFIELCFEGDRWLDLIRTGKADEVLSQTAGKTWMSADELLPVPAIELGNNPNLNPQNPGY